MVASWSALTRQDRRNVALLTGAGIAIRLILIFAYSPVLTNDSHSYLDLARRLGALHLKGSSGARAPGYPALLLVLGYSPRATWCVQALLGVITTLLLYALVRRLGGGGLLALVAGLLYTLDFDVLAVERMILTETLASFVLLVVAHLAVGLLESERPRRTTAVFLGLTLTYLCLVRPDALATSAYLALALAIRLRSSAPRTVFVSTLVPALVALAAWAGINRATIGVMSVSTVIGHNMIDHVAPYVHVEAGPNHAITAAYVAARSLREAHTSNLANLSADAEPAMERGSHLDAAHVSERLLSIALGVIVHHSAAYVGSSLKQWPRFWVPPNYAYQFGSGTIRVIWKLERAVLVVMNIAFVLLLATDLVTRARRRQALLSCPALILAGLVAVATLPATFLAYGDTGRYGYVYLPLVLSVVLATSGRLLRGAGAPAPALRGRPRPSRA